jgi:putative ABC transport system substrate-binding protein
VKRRQFIGLLGGAMISPPLSVFAQQPRKVPRIGYLFSFTPAEGTHLWEACRQGLRELGYVEGQNIILEPRWAEGQHQRLHTLAADLVRLEVDVIVAAATPASRAAKAATSAIPIVFVAVGEPLRAGLVASLARPGGNVTGLSLLTSELSGKRLQLLAAPLPKPLRVAALMNPDNPVSAIFWEETEVAARSIGVELQRLDARNPQEVERAFETAAGQGAGALIVFDDPVIWGHRAKVVALADKHRLPAMYGYRDFIDHGGLMSYGPDRPNQYRRTALFVDKILKGAKPADLPVEQPTKFQLVINLKAAKTLGLSVPSTLLAQADEVVE